jgi:glucokinase-like ROK family protein
MPPRSRYRTGDHELVRQMNLSVVMHHLRENPSTSRATLAEMTGLNKTTVSSLVQELMERRFVHEVGLESGGTGRPAMLLDLNPAAGCIVSCEIGVDFISVACTDFAPNITWRHQESIDPTLGQRAIIDRALASIRHAVEAGDDSCVAVFGLAVGVPGLVDQATGTLLFAPNLKWKNVPLRTLLQESFNAPIFVGNEANMAALGEHYFGAAQGYDEVLYVSAGVGLGGGLVHGGRVFNGVTGVAGEFGHMTMEPHGELCNCGNRGCWETQVSQRALVRHVRRAIGEGQSSQLSDVTEGVLERLSVPMIAEAARDGDVVALEALNRVGRDLGVGIASLVNALNPELVVFGGILSVAGEFLLPAVKEEMRQRALRWNREATQVVLAEHGFDACLMGGVAMVYQSILAQPNSTVLHNA